MQRISREQHALRRMENWQSSRMKIIRVRRSLHIIARLRPFAQDWNKIQSFTRSFDRSFPAAFSHSTKLRGSDYERNYISGVPSVASCRERPPSSSSLFSFASRLIRHTRRAIVSRAFFPSARDFSLSLSVARFVKLDSFTVEWSRKILLHLLSQIHIYFCRSRAKKRRERV